MGTYVHQRSNGVDAGLAVIGLAVTGGQFFNHLSNSDGSLALANEGPTLDSCFGHSAAAGNYHYHANINCTDAGAATGANDPDECVLIGYYRDGVPVYGLCKDSSGDQMTSCYSLKSGSTTSDVVTVGGTYTVADNESDYEFDVRNADLHLKYSSTPIFSQASLDVTWMRAMVLCTQQLDSTHTS